MSSNIYLQKMRRSANVGLYGSIAVALVVIAFYYLSPYRFYLDDGTARFMLLGGVVLAVLVIAMALLTVSRKPRQLRQLDSVEQRLQGYSSMVSSLYSTCLGCNAVLCTIILLSHNNILLMFVLLTVVVLFMSYPNMYKVKVDTGLTHEQMRQLYGDDYHGDEEASHGNE